jgi:hypothetical protein
VLTSLFSSSYVMRRQLCLEAGPTRELFALAGVALLVVDIVRTAHRIPRQLIEAVSELQALQWLCQLRQQLGLFSRHFFCALPQPSVALLLPAVAVGRS